VQVRAFPCLLAIVVTLLADPDDIEPSIRNEVDHALSVVPKGPFPPLGDEAAAFAALYATNGLSGSDRAIALVSSQKGGRWLWKGADVTPVAVWYLRSVLGQPQSPDATNVLTCVTNALYRAKNNPKGS